MIEAGTYRGVATEWGLGTSNNGTEQIAVRFNLPDVRESITWYGYFTDDAFPITMKALRTMGWTGQDLEDIYGLDANEVQLVVEHESYDGRTRPKVRWVNPMGNLSLKAPMDAARAKAFSARMRGKIAAFDKLAGNKPAPRPSSAPKAAAEPPPHTDDDMPF